MGSHALGRDLRLIYKGNDIVVILVLDCDITVNLSDRFMHVASTWTDHDEWCDAL